MKPTTEKNLSTLVEDIYKTVSDLNLGEKDIPEECLESLTIGIKKSILEWAKPKKKNGFFVRMSNIGRPARQLYYNKKSPRDVTPDASTLIKFLYGHILEEVLIFLVKLSDHNVTDQQKKVIVNGVTGHLDCKINGEVIDIKTASSFAFRKFKNGTLREDDPFGYMSQLAGYEHAEGTNNGGFLVINKESGEITLYQPEELDKPNIKTLREKKEMPIIQCDIREGRSPEQKAALASEITRVVNETIDAPIEYIYVLIRETPGAHHIKAGNALPDWVPPDGAK